MSTNTLSSKLKEAFDAGKKYTRRVDFWKAETAKYGLLTHYFMLDEACAHMPPRRGSKEYHADRLQKAMSAAKKYTKRTDFRIKERNNWQLLYRKGKLEEACQHMEVVGSKYMRLIYIVVSEKLNLAYIGLTYDFTKRKRVHLACIQKSTIKIVKAADCQIYPITEYMPAIDAQFYEEYYLNFARDVFGYVITNEIKTGGLGGNTVIWDKETVYHAARKYKTRSTFKAAHPGAYARMLREGYSKILYKEMKW